jgi:hypothetical protein
MATTAQSSTWIPLSLIEDTDEFLLFRFVPYPDDVEDEDARTFMTQIDGTIRINRNGNYPECISLRDDGPIKPALSVRISQFLSHLTFGPAGGDGPSYL